MKMGQPHQVPLSAPALALLKRLHEVRRTDDPAAYVFPGQARDKPLSNMSMNMLMRRMKRDAYTTHGFRSSFRDWCGDATSFPQEVAEAALAHSAGDSVVRAYRRGSALEKRRRLMDAWAAFLAKVPAENVVKLRA